MRKIWTVKTVRKFGAISATFMTLYEDERDIMSDSIHPSMGIARCEKNRKVTLEIGLNEIYTVLCSKEEGNELYLKLWKLYRDGGCEAIEKWVKEEKALEEREWLEAWGA